MLSVLYFVINLMSSRLEICYSLQLKHTGCMGLEHWHKSRARKWDPRAQIKHPCAHIVFASAFKALASYIISCISAPSSNILACEEKNMLERAQNALSKLSSARAQVFSSARSRVSFFNGRFLSVRGRAWGHANHHCIPEYNWLSDFPKWTASTSICLCECCLLFPPSLTLIW